MEDSEIDPVDIYVGKRLRFAREMQNISQTELGRLCGVSFQQIQKYENGFNRVSASRLVQMATYLNIPVEWFFEGVPKNHYFPNIDTALPDINLTLLYRQETKELLSVYYSIHDETMRRVLRDMMLSHAASQHNHDFKNKM